MRPFLTGPLGFLVHSRGLSRPVARALVLLARHVAARAASRPSVDRVRRNSLAKRRAPM